MACIMYHVPLIMQLISCENGMTTLAMILAYYKKYVSVEIVRQECFSTRNNTPIPQLMKASENAIESLLLKTIPLRKREHMMS